jgi:hypothetical protein
MGRLPPSHLHFEANERFRVSHETEVQMGVVM